MGWTKDLPQKKVLNCVAVADETFMQADRKLSLVERTGLDREKIRVAAFLPRLPGAEVDPGCRRYASYMGKKFRQHGLDFRVEEAASADILELLLMGAQVNDKVFGTFVFFPTPFGKTEDYFLRRVRPEKDIEGLTVENTGRMALNIKTVDEEEKYEGVVPGTASADEVLSHNPDGVFLSNGPGDPAAVNYAITTVKTLIGKKPIFGICLGHQLLGLAFGEKGCQRTDGGITEQVHHRDLLPQFLFEAEVNADQGQ